MARKLKNKIKTGQSLLLHYLWKKHGGPVNVSRLCGVGMQAANNWRIRGRVPLNMIRRVSEGLNESMWALNYEGMSALIDESKRPSWPDVVESCGLAHSSQYEILRLTPPVPYS